MGITDFYKKLLFVQCTHLIIAKKKPIIAIRSNGLCGSHF